MNTPNPVEAATSTPAASTSTNPSRGVNGPTTPTQGTKDHPKQDRHPRTARRAAPLLAHPQTRLWATALIAGALWITVLLWTLTKGPTS